MNFELPLHTEIKECHKCALRDTIPRGFTPVPGYGDVNARLMLIGECPGRNEVEQCKPFIGDAGAILSRVLKTVDIERRDIYVANVINCWSRCGNSNIPVPEYAITSCKGWLWQQIQLVDPKVLITMGKVPTTLLLKPAKKTYTLKSMIGKQYTVDWHTCQIFPCYHPSYVLRGSSWALDMIIDVFKKVKEIL